MFSFFSLSVVYYACIFSKSLEFRESHVSLVELGLTIRSCSISQVLNNWLFLLLHLPGGHVNVMNDQNMGGGGKPGGNDKVVLDDAGKDHDSKKK